MANGNIEYNGRTYHPQVKTSRECDGIYTCSLTLNGFGGVSVEGRGADTNRSLAAAVDAFKQEMDARKKLKKDKIYDMGV